MLKFFWVNGLLPVEKGRSVNQQGDCRKEKQQEIFANCPLTKHGLVVHLYTSNGGGENDSRLKNANIFGT